MIRTRLRPVSKKRAKADKDWPEIRAFVMERDDNACQFYKGRGALVGVAPHGGELDPHHVVPKGRDIQLRLEPTNLLTLCRNHHDWVHAHPNASTAFGLLASVPPE